MQFDSFDDAMHIYGCDRMSVIAIYEGSKMPVEVIIRFSIDNERNSALRNKLNTKLEGHGFSKLQSRTATYLNSSISDLDLSNAMSDFWSEVHGHKGTGTIDHFWMYADQELSTEDREKISSETKKED